MNIVRARTNNLRDVTLSIPKHEIVVFTGVSGSGKSSLVFDTIAAESQRQLNETYSTFIRHRLPHYGTPDADRLENLPVSILVDQKRLGGNARSTVGTATDISALLRLLFSRLGKPFVGEASAFSFNNVEGMCPECEGLGKVDDIDLDALLDKSKTMNEGPFRFPGWHVGSYRWKRYALTGFFDNDKPLTNYTKAEWARLVDDTGAKVTDPLPGWYDSSQYESVLFRFRRTYINREKEAANDTEREALGRVLTRGPCPACGGGRLKPEVLASRIKGKSIADCSGMEIDRLIEFLVKIDDRDTKAVVDGLTDRLHAMVGLGLEYLSLDRETPTLSGGESQRIKMVRHLGSSLSDIAYIFDEPSTGLHPRDVHQVTELLQQLRDNGNSVLVVEHDPDVIAVADHIIDIGPGAGRNGGNVVFDGSLDAFRGSTSPTARAFLAPRTLQNRKKVASGYIGVAGGTQNNVKNIDVTIPLGMLTVVVGVAGSGKSTLTKLMAQQNPGVVRIDQSALGGSRRSTPATYLGVHEPIRSHFAKESGKRGSLFSTNASGACPACKGAGVIRTDLAFMDSEERLCGSCNGSGFSAEALAVRIKGKTIADIALMTAQEARAFFSTFQNICAPLERMKDVGLSYMPIGQSLSSLSGGERQRLRLADELGRDSEVYLLDEPTSGLHMTDVDRLIELIQRLLDRGKTVVVVEHNLEVMAKADWIIEMGPGAGRRGGKITFAGEVAALLDDVKSITAPFLSGYLAGRDATGKVPRAT
ncbi:MAG: excinuclease ABC subunit UvrA [Candidatus Devosia phytovorans]|uniref:UvrABC system protein A n=1 Tax=Candidatus Devosia phytovorans TaxID=3121372 RepID=A0AAJ5VSR6_9HYPH|nr:excinuclease ABC subunit UvrA [Devosia sp.]WEK02972.1 MAG: excinuclease ABC subunit UvrA [Devosia sp.]